MATTALASSTSDVSRSVSSRGGTPFPPDPRAFDFSFAFNNPEFSDRLLLLRIQDEEQNDAPREAGAEGSLDPLVNQEGASPLLRIQEEQSDAPHAEALGTSVQGNALEHPRHAAGAEGSLDPLVNQEDVPDRGREEARAEGTLVPLEGSLCGRPVQGKPDQSEREQRPMQERSAQSESSAENSAEERQGDSSLENQENSPVLGRHVAGAEGSNGMDSAPSGVSGTSTQSQNGTLVKSTPSGEGKTAVKHPNAEGRTAVKHQSIEGKTIELHVISAILVSQSDFFRSLFSPQWSGGSSQAASQRPAVSLKLLPDEEMPFLELMRFMYTGRLSIEEDPEAVLHLLLVANKFGVLSCVNVCAHNLREVPLSLDIACILLRVCSGVMLSEAASFLVASSASFLVTRFGNLDVSWKSPEFLDLPLEALEAILGSDDVCVTSEATVFASMLHWVRHQCPDDLNARKDLVARLAEKVRFAAMDTEALRQGVMTAPEADVPSVQSLVMDALWFKCSPFEKQQELVLSSIRQHRRYVRRRQLSIHSEVLLQDCYMLQPSQAILLSGGAWVCGKLFSLKVMRVAAPVGGSDFGLFLQASQRCPTQDKVLDDSVSVEFSFKVKEWPAGAFVQQKQSASHTFKGLFRERGYRSLLSPWNEVMKDNNKYFRNGVMYIRADLRVIHPGESLAPLE